MVNLIIRRYTFVSLGTDSYTNKRVTGGLALFEGRNLELLDIQRVRLSE